MYHLFCDKSKQLLQGKTTTVLSKSLDLYTEINVTICYSYMYLFIYIFR